MNELTIFTSEEFGQVRTTELNGKTYFSGLDVARALGYTNPSKAVSDHCRNAIMGRGNDSLGRQQVFKLIPEGDVYRLISRSNLPSADKFERWVFDEVIPSIRKHGLYAMDDLINNPDLAIKALTALKEEREKNARLAAVNEELKPKAEIVDAITESSDSISIGDMAKLLKQNGVNTGQNRFYKWLRENGYIMGEYTPTQRAMEMKLFIIRERPVTLPDGTQKLVRTPKVTGKGQAYFLKKLDIWQQFKRSRDD